MKILGQRWEPWLRDSLGFSTTTTIGSHGCTITCIAMLAGLDPRQVNERLKSVSGFANTNLVIWTKIQQAIPWLSFEWRGYAYDNDKVKAAIAKNGACLVEVDFDNSERTDQKHWVLLIGDGKMYDPWTGTERRNSEYSIYTGYAVINKIGTKPEIILGENMIEVPKETFELLVTKSGKYDSFANMGYTDPQKLKETMEAKDLTINSLSNDLGLARENLSSLQVKFNDTVALLKTTNENLTSAQRTLDIVIKTAKDKFGMTDSSFISEEAFSQALEGLSRGGNVSELLTSELFNEITRRFFSSLDQFRKN